MSQHKTDNGKDRSQDWMLESDVNSEAIPISISQDSTLLNYKQNPATPDPASESFVPEKAGKLVKVETKLPENSAQLTFQQLKAKATAILIGSAVMLPILAVGTATYYFGSQAVKKQAILTKRADNIGITETELARQQELLAALLIGTGTTALLAGGIAALGTKRLLDSISEKSTASREETEAATVRVYKEYIQNLNQSSAIAVSRDNLSITDRQSFLLEDIVEEARGYLKCDRVVVYSLNRDRYGVIVAESVEPGYTSALNKTIEDPCFEARYLEKYRDGRVRAIDNIYEAEMTTCHLEQLEQLEVKANLVTPITHEGQLFGLLVAHQCATARRWQKTEIEFLHQLAQKAGLALENAKLSDEMVHLQAQTEIERKWTYYFTDAIQYIRQSLKQDNVLEISTEEVRRVLECDRVLVYSLNQDRYGIVIAESVAPGYPRALNRVISDPCFEAKYLAQYQDGRVRAIDNIYEAGMSQCYIEQLETLQVKANLVTPILNEGQLFGLLVAHQCDRPRNWQDYEIRWTTQIATQVGFALDNAVLLQRLKNDGIPTQPLKNFSLGIAKAVNEPELLNISVEQARKAIQLDRVIVYMFDNDWNGTIVAESVVPGYPRGLNSQIKDPCFAQEYAEKFLQGYTKAIANVHHANLTDCHLKQIEKLNVKASLIVPILQDRQLFGLLIGHQCEGPRLWKQSETDLFAQLALQLGFALDRMRLKERLYQTPDIDGNQQQQEVSELLKETQAALQNLQTKINQQHQAIANKDPKDMQPLKYREISEQPPNLKQEITVAQKAITQCQPFGLIALATEKVESLNQSHQNPYQIASPINSFKDQMDRPSTKQIAPAQLPVREITVEADDEVASPAIDSYNPEISHVTGQIVEADESQTSSILMNQFVTEITDLSSQISQQSLTVTNSFQKLAEFAKKLSDLEES